MAGDSNGASNGAPNGASLYGVLQARIRSEQPVGLATVIDGPNIGAKLLIEPATAPLGSLGIAYLDETAEPALEGREVGGIRRERADEEARGHAVAVARGC